MRRYIPIFIVLSLVGCAGDAQTRATASLAIACDSYATALEQLTLRKASLGASTIASVDQTNKVVSPVCSPGSPFDPAVAVGIVQNALAIIKQF